VSVLVRDPYERAALERVRPLVAARRPVFTSRPPLEGRWRAAVDQSRHHQRKAWAIFALDLVRVDERGRHGIGEGARNEDYLSWEAPVYAPADGVIEEAVGDEEDIPPGAPGEFGEGNTLSIRHPDGSRSDFFHLRQGSFVVAEGDEVRAGALLARIGNNGASAAPHLHYEVTIPIHDGERGEWLGVPFRWTDYRLVAVEDRACDVEVRVARPREGWTMLLPPQTE
jgi:hypothetical protein